MGRTEKGCGATDVEAIKAFFLLSRTEGIIPALETAHAVAYAYKLAKLAVVDGIRRVILVNVSGRGDKDLDYVLKKWGHITEADLTL
jgi:tryptophan synthase beta chain